MTSIVTRHLRLLAATKVLESAAGAEGPYYVWVGNPIDPSVDRDIYDDVFYSSVEPYSRMAFGAAVTASDAALMAREIPYVANTVYAQYDDQDPEIFTKDYYVTVTSGDFVHAFKCLYNNNGIPSTSAPDIGDVDPGDIVYQTADGYQWKYLYTVEDTDILKFSSPGYVPVIANSSVTAEAVSGAIDVVIVSDAGEGYRNHLTGTFSTTDIQVGGNGQIYLVGSNTAASTSNGFYTGCVMYLSSGTGAGSYKSITDYVSNSSGRYVTLASSFLTTPTNGTGWEISPEVIITGSGTQTSNAKARAVVNAAGNTISRVEVLDRGAGYASAIANVQANSVVSVTSAASVRPVNGPPGGHGYNVASELGVSRASISVRLDGSLSNTVPATGRFGQHGIMSRPVFSTANLGFSAYGGSPSIGATYQSLSTVRVEGAVTTTASSNVITKSDAAFDQVFSVGSNILVTDTTDRYLGVVTVVNSSSVQVATALGWSTANAQVFTASPVATAVIGSVNAGNSVVVESIDGLISVGDSIIVGNGGHWATIDSMTRSGVSKTQATFVQMQKVVGSYVSGTMQENEVVYQGESLSTATVTAWSYSVKDDGGTITVYLTDVFGVINASAALKGNTSGSSLSISENYPAELVPRSGSILYIENHAAVTRSNTQAEELNLLLDF